MQNDGVARVQVVQRRKQLQRPLVRRPPLQLQCMRETQPVQSGASAEGGPFSAALERRANTRDGERCASGSYGARERCASGLYWEEISASDSYGRKGGEGG